jgi:hypothetical protein
MYAELSERARVGQMAEDFDPAGLFVKRTHQGRHYWYFRSATVAGSRHDKYVGPGSPEPEQRIARHRVEKSGCKERRTLVSALIRSGLRGPDARTGRILQALAKAGVFRMRALVGGSAAYQTYPGTGRSGESRQAGDLIAILAAQRPYELRDVWEELTARGPNWRRLATEAVNSLDHPTGSTKAREALESAIGG